MPNLSVRKFQTPPQTVELPDAPKLEFDLEIGAGTGTHALDYCERHPSRQLVAIERTHNKYKSFKSKAEAQKVSNLMAFQGDAIWWVAQKVQHRMISRVFLLYPNPYPKNAQKALRWHASPFMGLLLNRIVPGGQLQLATNIPAYFEEALLYYENYWGLKVEQSLITDRPGRTAFEKKYLARGETCFQLNCRLIDGWTPPHPHKLTH
ncbi:MAG: hypothetical protein KDD22_08025 [Bdellovibrionales bacterium]|nr:hypothetical protein [Bdellovibrionales bacterium]